MASGWDGKMASEKVTFVIGGCRSGKSRHALELAKRVPDTGRLFLATCIPQDDEMKQRIANHQKERGAGWSTLETPIRLPDAIREKSPQSAIILVDCLTLWISNLLLDKAASERIDDHVRDLIRSLETAKCPVILVSNEVGTGIVPENRLARKFRDVTGHANQAVAACADKVTWMLAGIPVSIFPKSPDHY